MKKRYRFFHIRAFCVCVLLIAAISLLRGLFKGEIVLRLLGAALFIPVLYSFVCCMILSMIHRKKVKSLYANIGPKTVKPDENAFISLVNQTKGTSEHQGGRIKFFSMPAILIRYKLYLHTKDNKTIDHIFRKKIFESDDGATFPAKVRGAYYGGNGTILIADIFGFFYCSLFIDQNRETLRLLVLPSPRDAININTSYSGGNMQHNENKIIKSDDLLDQRLYIPGDDPRRINWKLYSHIGELFVRTEEMQHPPKSKLTLLINTEYDSYMFSQQEAAKLLDDICGAAFAIILENERHNIFTELSYGISYAAEQQKYYSGSSKALAEALSYPAAASLNENTVLPKKDDRSIVIMSMVHSINFCGNALANFVLQKPPAQTIELFFCYNKINMLGAAEACALKYCRTVGLHAKSVLV